MSARAEGSEIAALLEEARRRKADEVAADAAAAADPENEVLGAAIEEVGERAHHAIRAMVAPRSSSLDDVLNKVAAYGLCYYGEDLREHLVEEIDDVRRTATADRLVYSILRDLVDMASAASPSLDEEIAAYLVAHDAFSAACARESAGGVAAAVDASFDELEAATERLLRFIPTNMSDAAAKLEFLWSFRGPFEAGGPTPEQVAQLVDAMRGAGRADDEKVLRNTKTLGGDQVNDPDPLLAFITRWEDEEAECVKLTDGKQVDREWEKRTGPFAEAAMRGELPHATTPAGAARALRKAIGVADLSIVERSLMDGALHFLEAQR